MKAAVYRRTHLDGEKVESHRDVESVKQDEKKLTVTVNGEDLEYDLKIYKVTIWAY